MQSATRCGVVAMTDNLLKKVLDNYDMWHNGHMNKIPMGPIHESFGEKEIGILVNACKEKLSSTLYVIQVHDRHSEDSLYVFTDVRRAIGYARNEAKKYCRFYDDYKEKKVADWIFYAEYSCEGDYVRVIKCELDKEPEHFINEQT